VREAQSSPDEHGARRELERALVAQARRGDRVAVQLDDAVARRGDHDGVALVGRGDDVAAPVERDAVHALEPRVLDEHVLHAQRVRRERGVAARRTAQVALPADLDAPDRAARGVADEERPVAIEGEAVRDEVLRAEGVGGLAPLRRDRHGRGRRGARVAADAADTRRVHVDVVDHGLHAERLVGLVAAVGPPHATLARASAVLVEGEAGRAARRRDLADRDGRAARGGHAHDRARAGRVARGRVEVAARVSGQASRPSGLGLRYTVGQLAPESSGR